MPEGMDDPRLTAEGELALAQLAMHAGDLRQAAGHLAHAIARAPTLPEVHETLSRLAARSDGGLELFPLDPHTFIGTVVARAHLLAAAGQPDDGLDLLIVATSHAPGVDWAGLPWVTAPELATRLDPDRIAQLVMRLCAVLPDPVPEAGRLPLLSYLTLAGHAVVAHPGHGLLLGAASVLARRLGANRLAVDWARRGALAWPTKLTEVWLGYAHRSAGDIDAALAALRRAIRHDPDDLSVYADLAGTLADHGRLREALDWIDRALARDPSYDCAVHTGHRLRYRRDGALRHLIALADYQRDHPDISHEHADLAECCRGQPWLGRVTEAEGALTTRLRQRPGAKAGTGGRIRLRGLEPPSAMRTAAAVAPGLVVTVAGSPEPDLREPRRPPARPLWAYDGLIAVPALPPPSASAVERIQRLARPAWPHPPAAYDRAVGLATVTPDDLLGLLVHPPAPPPDLPGRAVARHDPTLWVRCAQVWACLGLLHHRTDEPWPGSARRALLLDLVWGVEDWVTEAALFALVTAAWVDPAVRPEVAGVAAERLTDAARVARSRPVLILGSLARLALATPDLDPVVAGTARDLLDRGRTGRTGWWSWFLPGRPR